MNYREISSGLPISNNAVFRTTANNVNPKFPPLQFTALHCIKTNLLVSAAHWRMALWLTPHLLMRCVETYDGRKRENSDLCKVNIVVGCTR